MSDRVTRRALVVEDDPELSHLIARLLRRSAIESAVVGRLGAAREALAAGTFDALVIDRSLPDGDGAAFISELRAQGSALPAVLMSGAPVAAPDGLTRFLQKPFSIDALPLLLATMLAPR